jgi:hypothetical protein
VIKAMPNSTNPTKNSMPVAQRLPASKKASPG